MLLRLLLPLRLAAVGGSQPLGGGTVEAAAIRQSPAHQLQRVLACKQRQ